MERVERGALSRTFFDQFESRNERKKSSFRDFATRLKAEGREKGDSNVGIRIRKKKFGKEELVGLSLTLLPP